MRAPIALLTTALVVISSIMLSANAETDEDTLRKLRPSIVKIETSSTAATGFLWGDSAHAVTSLHVVDGHEKITVSYIDANGKIYASSAARVSNVLKESDLVLLELTRPQALSALEIDTNYPKAKQVLDALGFPLNIAAHSTTQVKVRFGGKTLQTILPKKVLDKLGEYPSPNTTILNLEGNLLPGLSGAPIINDQGRVVGIVDGGLENGAIGISWGIPADKLLLLLASAISTLPNATSIHELFAADLDVEIATPKKIGDKHLTKLRSRNFAQLVETSDDLIAVTQLATLFAVFNPNSFEYDIYQETSSGATIVLPKDIDITQQGNLSVAALENSQMQIKFRIEHAGNMVNSQLKSQIFEQELTEYTPGVQVFPDPFWSYLRPLTSYGVTVNRKALYRNIFNGFIWQPNKYYFETLASNGDTLLAIAAVNNDNSVETAQLLTLCMQGIHAPECGYLLDEKKLWAQMVLGVQFSSFPAKIKD